MVDSESWGEALIPPYPCSTKRPSVSFHDATYFSIEPDGYDLCYELEMKLSQHHPENPQTILALLRLEPNRPLSMRAMTKIRQRKSVARVMAPMKTSGASVRIHSAGQTRIGNIES